MNPAIFREYDIRGLAEQDFDEKFALLLGKVHGTIIAERGGKRVTVGRDCRATSDPYAEAVIAGLASTGLQVYDIGICPTPLLYFSLFHLNVDGGIEVTASHNPSEYNGFKLCIGKDTLYGQQIQDVRVKMDRNEFKEKAGGKVERYEILSPYQKHLLQDVPKLKRPLKVVVDAGSGVGGPVAPPLFRQLGCLVWEIACKPDGNFPIHHPDPTIPENLELLIEKVKHEYQLRLCRGRITFDGSKRDRGFNRLGLHICELGAFSRIAGHRCRGGVGSYLHSFWFGTLQYRGRGGLCGPAGSRGDQAITRTFAALQGEKSETAGATTGREWTAGESFLVVGYREVSTYGRWG